MTTNDLNYALVSYEVQPDGSLLYPWIVGRYVREDVAQRYADDYNALYTTDSPLIAVVEPA